MHMVSTQTFCPPVSRRKITFEAVSAVVYISDLAPFGATAYLARRARPDFDEHYCSIELRDQRIASWVSSLALLSASKADARAKRKAWNHSLDIGDILASVRGDEQTSIAFYEVIALSGAGFVELRELAQEHRATSSNSGTAMPKAGCYQGEVIRRRVQTFNSVRLESHAFATPYDGQPRLYSTG